MAREANTPLTTKTFIAVGYYDNMEGTGNLHENMVLVVEGILAWTLKCKVPFWVCSRSLARISGREPG